MNDTTKTSDAKPGGKPGQPIRPNPPWEKLEQMDPMDWPRYHDPQGRKLTGREYRRAKRALASMGIEAINSNHATHLAAHYGVDVFSTGGTSILDLGTVGTLVPDSSPEQKADKKADGVGGTGGDAGGGAGGGTGGGGALGSRLKKNRNARREGGNKQGGRNQGGSEGALALLQDPSKDNMLAPTEEAKTPAKKNNPNLTPQSISQSERDAAIQQMQRELVRRRRGRFVAMMLRLIVFVGLPTGAVGYYLAEIATPMYETESEFVIQTSENPASAGGLGGLLAGTGFATSQDSVVVQGYLGSREAYIRLNNEFGYAEHFQNPEIDVIQRLDMDATRDEAYAYFKRRVTIGYDPTEGIIRMTVVAATPEDSQRFAEALVGYAETRVDGLTQEARGDQLIIAEARYLESEGAMLDAERKVLELQQQRGVLSAEVELSSQMSIISSLELELENAKLELSELLANARPSESRVLVQRQKIARLDMRIAELRGELTQTGDNSVSLARISGELRVAESALATRHLILQESIASMEGARLEASRQVRFLSLGVAPVAPVEATYPRKVESTILAFLAFMGIYIMASLTMSILREQVSV